MIARHLTILFCLVCNFAGSAQKDIVIPQYDFAIPDSCVNRYDQNGKSTGVWVLYESPYCIVRYDKAGKAHGKCSIYTLEKTDHAEISHKLSDIYYSNGLISGPIIKYHENGVVSSYISKISRLDEGERYDTRLRDNTGFAYKGYEVDYDECGSIKAEGWCIFGAEPVTEGLIDIEPVGDWKIYDENEKYTTVNKGDRIDN